MDLWNLSCFNYYLWVYLQVPLNTCKWWFTHNPQVFDLRIQVIHGKRSLQVWVWVLVSKIPVGRVQVNPQVHLCPALISACMQLNCSACKWPQINFFGAQLACNQCAQVTTGGTQIFLCPTKKGRYDASEMGLVWMMSWVSWSLTAAQGFPLLMHMILMSVTLLQNRKSRSRGKWIVVEWEVKK